MELHNHTGAGQMLFWNRFVQIKLFVLWLACKRYHRIAIFSCVRNNSMKMIVLFSIW